jgi:hypothetical protein
VHRVTWDIHLTTWEKQRGFHALWRRFPSPLICRCSQLRRSRYPRKTSFSSLGCSAFARRYSQNHSRFIFLRLLRCFTSPRLAIAGYFIGPQPTMFPWLSCLIRKSLDRCPFAAPQGLSQLTTSFIACQHQGIRLLHLLA